MRLVIATCTVDYKGRIDSHLPLATRLLIVTRTGSVSIHSDDRAYKPLNWMSAPCQLVEEPGRWTVTGARGDQLVVTIAEVLTDVHHHLGDEPGITKDGVEAQLQEMLADNPHLLGMGWRVIRREHPTDIGPVDLLCLDGSGQTVAVEVKRTGEIAGVEQLARYLERLDLDARLRPVRGVFAAQTIKPQARILAEARGITCVELDYDILRGRTGNNLTLF